MLARTPIVARAVSAIAFALAAFSAAQAQTPSHRTFRVLTADQVRPERILPPPPVDGGDVTAAELAELRNIAKITGPEQWKRAAWDDEHEDGQIFQEAISPAYDLAKLPATARLLAEVRNEEAVAAGIAKDYFKRSRPWILDPSLHTCSREDPPLSSYPSGHATMAFAMATVLADVAPTLAPQLLRRARDYSQERLTCAMHYRSDIVAGEVLGTTVGVLMLREPHVQADIAASRAELAAAHVVEP